MPADNELDPIRELALLLLRRTIVGLKQANQTQAYTMQWQDFHPDWQARALAIVHSNVETPAE